MKHLTTIYQTCYQEIGGNSNNDIKWYLNDRPKTINRASFFEEAVWAIWVSGMKRVTVKSFLNRAEELGFNNRDFQKVADTTASRWKKFKVNLHCAPVPMRAEGKWDAIKVIAEKLNEYKEEKSFRTEWFSGKVKSCKLCNNDVKDLIKRKLPYIGAANANFIIRNMGGEAIKCDRWMEKFMQYYKISQQQLITKLNDLNIPIGLFDMVIWAYCEEYVRRTKKFFTHFSNKFGS
ncbi:MAG: hypothetical protein HZB81_03745 [Deltaproteobacteria bacterium]|nr:hypothetical protein [Deltaproteobacteria bacterium]